MKTIIILGSSRTPGNTSKIAAHLSQILDCEVLNLSDYSFSYYDYDAQNEADDFTIIAEQIIRYERIIFATPVYWYAMSGIMKVFLDRFTDLITINKHIGRSLAGKRMDLVICSSDSTEYEWFDKPFRATADYLDMTFVQSIHTWIEENEISNEVLERLDQMKN